MAIRLNYLLYQVGWFACMLGPARGYVLAGTLLGVAVVVAHLGLARRRRDELALVLVAAAIGLVIDSTQIRAGTLRFPIGVVAAPLPPPWLVVIWMQFATTFHYGMRWLKGRPTIAAAFGALGGPLAFLAGSRLGVVALHPAVWPSLVSLAILWTVAMPALAWMATRQNGRPGIGEYRWPAGHAGDEPGAPAAPAAPRIASPASAEIDPATS